MPSTRETILQALLAALQTVPATVLRGEVLPERVPAEGLLILRDGKPGEPEVTLSPLAYHYQHRAEIEAVVQGAARDTAFDTLTASIGTALAADRTLGGLCDWVEAEAPRPRPSRTSRPTSGRRREPCRCWRSACRRRYHAPRPARPPRSRRGAGSDTPAATASPPAPPACRRAGSAGPRPARARAAPRRAGRWQVLFAGRQAGPAGWFLGLTAWFPHRAFHSADDRTRYYL